MQAIMIETIEEQTILITEYSNMYVIFKFVCRNRCVHVYGTIYCTKIDTEKFSIEHTS